MRHFDEAFADPFAPESSTPTDKGISREVFLANESLKRQREARNFRYEGDVDAPKLTRSGRVVGKQVMDDEGDYGAEKEEEEEEEEEIEEIEEIEDRGLEVEGMDIASAQVILPINEDIELPAVNDQSPLLPEARQHILNILSTLTGHHTSRSPPPFVDEETNEALQGLVNLLKGTVERGEGNSALVVGPRGSGKTRVSHISPLRLTSRLWLGHYDFYPLRLIIRL
jgi:origin recognition complex subunit 4